MLPRALVNSHDARLLSPLQGHDALVLEGAKRAISTRQIAILEFEVTAKGYWATAPRDALYSERRSLASTIEWLRTAGYECFWQADGLVPMSGPCWLPFYEASRWWSNAVCAHDPAVISRLRSFGPGSLDVPKHVSGSGLFSSCGRDLAACLAAFSKGG